MKRKELLNKYLEKLQVIPNIFDNDEVKKFFVVPSSDNNDCDWFNRTITLTNISVSGYRNK